MLSPADARLALVSELQQTTLFKEIPGLGMFRLDPEKKEMVLAALRTPPSGALTRDGIAREDLTRDLLRKTLRSADEDYNRRTPRASFLSGARIEFLADAIIAIISPASGAK